VPGRLTGGALAVHIVLSKILVDEKCLNGRTTHAKTPHGPANTVCKRLLTSLINKYCTYSYIILREYNVLELFLTLTYEYEDKSDASLSASP